MSESKGKYYAKLRLIEVDRKLGEWGEPEAETDEFIFSEDEEIIDVVWFSNSVSVTVADVKWTKNTKYIDPEPIPCGPNCVVTQETVGCHPASPCNEWEGVGLFAQPYAHPMNTEMTLGKKLSGTGED